MESLARLPVDLTMAAVLKSEAKHPDGLGHVCRRCPPHGQCSPPGMDTWVVTLYRAHGAPWSFDYHKGVGLREPKGSRRARPVAPELREVVACLASDASSYLNARDLDDFASEYGYQKPSETIKAWEGCERAARAFRSLGLDPSATWEA